MGKKSKQKKNRQNPQSTKSMQVKIQKQPENVLTGGNAQAHMQAAARPTSQFDDTSYIRKDIIRIILTLGVMIIILAATTILSHQTSYIQTAGNHLSSFLKLAQ